MNFNINMVSFKETPHFVIPRNGHYLVQRESIGIYKSVDWFATHVTRHFNEKTNKWHNSFNCNGRITHISSMPLKYNETIEEQYENINQLIESVKQLLKK